MNPQPPRFAVIDCEDLPHWNGHVDYWTGALTRPGDVWDVYRAWAGELPPDPAVYRGIVITGSHHSVNDPEQQHWLEPLFEWVRRTAGEARGGRVLGACFGLQVVARALGGRVEPNPVGRFVFGTERVALDAAFHRDLDGGAAGPAEITMLSSHSEQATLLPPGARSLGRSATADHEVFTIGDHVLAVQFHAEFTREIMLEKILPRLRAAARQTADQEARSLASLEAAVDSDRVRAAFRRWLDRPPSR